MSKEFGPWATPIDVGGNPQLNAFWRRRMTLLASASRSKPALSRLNLLSLATAALLVVALPTVHFAEAGQEKALAGKGGNAAVAKPSEKTPPKAGAAAKPDGEPKWTDGDDIYVLGEDAPAAKGAAAGAKPAEKNAKADSSAGRSYAVYGSVTVTGSPGDCYIPSLVYGELNSEGTRKLLGLTDEQEKKLREMARKDWAERMATGDKLRKAMETLPPDKRAVASREYQAQVQREMKDVRGEIEQLLNAAQLKTLRTIAIGQQGVGRLVYDPQAAKEVGISDQQRKELAGRLFEDDAAKAVNRRLEEELKKKQDEAVALVTPKQWAEIEKMGTGILGDYPSPELGQLLNTDTAEQLGFSAEQKKKAIAIFESSQAVARELSKLVDRANRPQSAKEQAAATVKLDRKLQEMRQHDLDQIKALLTNQQFAGLERRVGRQLFLMSFYQAGYTNGDFYGGGPMSGMFDLIHATAKQKKEWGRLAGEMQTLIDTSFHERGEMALRILSPEQEDKLIDVMDRIPQAGYAAEYVAQSDNEGKNEQGRLMKVGAGTLTLSNGLAPADTKDGEKKPTDSGKPDESK